MKGKKILTWCWGRKPLRLWLWKRQKKIKKLWEGIEREIKEEEDKALKNCDLIPICFKNTIFDRLRGIEKGIEITREFKP